MPNGITNLIIFKMGGSYQGIFLPIEITELLQTMKLNCNGKQSRRKAYALAQEKSGEGGASSSLLRPLNVTISLFYCSLCNAKAVFTVYRNYVQTRNGIEIINFYIVVASSGS